MGKEEQIENWLRTAEEDWEVVHDLLKVKKYLHALFFVHLSVEKLLKAHWVRCNSSVPPKIHDLMFLHDQTDLELDGNNLELLESLNSWNLEGRYPDYKRSLHKIATEAYTNKKIEQVESLRKWLLEKMQ